MIRIMGVTGLEPGPHLTLNIEATHRHGLASSWWIASKSSPARIAVGAHDREVTLPSKVLRALAREEAVGRVPAGLEPLERGVELLVCWR